MSTLYFIPGLASDAQKTLAKKAGAKIRNSLAYHDGDTIESCSDVMGDVPEAYAKKYKKSKYDADAIKLVKAEEKAKAEAEAKANAEAEDDAKAESE